MRTKIDYKKAINEFIDLPKLIKVIWIALWVILAYFVVLKLLFHKWYPIVVENQIFINICSYLDNTLVLRHLIKLVFYFVSCNILILSGLTQKKYKTKKQFIIFNILLIITFLLKTFIAPIGTIFELIPIVILPIIMRKYKRYIPLLVYLMINVWQFNNLLIRDIDLGVINNNTLLSLVIMMDYYIFIIITWIGGAFMGTWTAGWFFGKTETEIKAELEKERKKEKPDKEKITALEDYLNEHFK